MPSSDADPVEGVLAAVRATAARDGLLAGGRILVAVSGGADSTCLLDALVLLHGADRLMVAHVDHGFRPASGRDAEHVRGLARSMGVESDIASIDGPKFAREAGLGIEAAGRRLRYRALAELAARHSCTTVVTGHTRDDAVESFLLHLVRGSGLDGLGGIAPREPLAGVASTAGDEPLMGGSTMDGSGVEDHSTVLERPLLDVGRRETAEYCRARGQTWLHDPTNDDPGHLRNRIRHHLLPVLRTYSPAIDGTLDRTARLLRDERAWVDGLVEDAWTVAGRTDAEGVSLDLGRLAAAPTALRRRLVRHAVELAGGHADTLSLDAVERVVAVADARGPARTELGAGLVATRDDRLHVRRDSGAVRRETGGQRAPERREPEADRSEADRSKGERQEGQRVGGPTA